MPAKDKAFAGFLNRCRSALTAFTTGNSGEDCLVFPTESFILLFRSLTLLKAGLTDPTGLGGSYRKIEKTFSSVWEATHLPLFSKRYNTRVSDQTFRAGTVELCREGDGFLPDVYFRSMPINWLGRAYQTLIGHSQRKKAGVYFTPDYLVRYVLDSALETLLDGPGGQRTLFETSKSIEDIRLIDPSMGSGDFLVEAVETLAKRLVEVGLAGGSDQLPVTSDQYNLSPSPSPKREGSYSSPLPFWEGGPGGLGYSAFRTPHSALGRARSIVAQTCVFGLDLDPIAVEVARASLALMVGLDQGPFDSLTKNLRVGDTLLGCIDGVDGDAQGEPWPICFPDACGERRDPPGFDMVVGNPPYVASKNGHLSEYGRKLGQSGQSDSYLMFVKHIADGGLLRQGGVFSMVLPDPVLARGNAKEAREILFNRWTPISLLHVTGAFSDALVANAIPVCRNLKTGAREFRAARISYLSDRFAFAAAPGDIFRRKSFVVDRDTVTAQPGREALYLADTDYRRSVLSRIHGPGCKLDEYLPPFVPLSDLGVERIFRGEEIGKAAAMRNAREAVESTGTTAYPILLGGQSIARYRITWEGARIAEVKKPLDWYIGRKIVLQKSAPKIVAALDEGDIYSGGYVVPQSVYCIKPGKVDPFFLLALLNSGFIGEYVFRMFTGYKMLQPQIELEDVKRLPMRLIEFTTPAEERKKLLDEGTAICLPATEDGSLDRDALIKFVDQRLNRMEEQADVLHDLLASLAKWMISLSAEDPRDEHEKSEYDLRCAAGQRAVDIIVDRLYGFSRY